MRYALALIILLTLAPIAVPAQSQTLTPQCPSPCPADIVLVVDTSGSMESRLEELKNATKTTINLTCTDGARWLGLVYFNTTAGRLTPSLVPIDDPGDQALLNSLVDGLTAGGRTNMGEGIRNATNLLLTTGRPGVPDVMIIVSDGEPNTGPDAATEASIARSQGIIIVGLYIGDPTGGGDEFLQSISDYFINGSAPGFNLTEAFIQLSNDICPLVELLGRPALVGGEASLATAAINPWLIVAATILLAGALAARRLG